MKIAFFDFDGTITTKDSMIEFIRFVFGDKKTFLGLLLLSPIIFLYKLRLISNHFAKQKLLSYFFSNYKIAQFNSFALEYSLKHIDKIVRHDALERINWHKNKGHHVVIVSASIETWLKPWCEKNKLELVATKLNNKNGYITGQFDKKNCYGIEKVNRIKEIYTLEKYEFIYVYGDSDGDKEMLALANKSYYKYFN